MLLRQAFLTRMCNGNQKTFLLCTIRKFTWYGNSNGRSLLILSYNTTHNTDVKLVPWKVKSRTGLGNVPFQFGKEILYMHHIRKNILSDSYLKLDRFKDHCKGQKLRIGDCEKFRTRREAEFNKSGSQNITTEKFLNLICVAENEEHLNLIFQIIQVFLKDDLRVSDKDKTYVLTAFTSICHVLGNINYVRSIWKDKSIVPYTSDSSRKIYYMLLYNHGEYEQIMDDIMNDPFYNDPLKDMSADVRLIAIAALCKIGTVDAFSNVSTIVQLNKDIMPNRPLEMYAWFAFKLKKYDVAYDTVTNGFPNHNFRRLSIILEIHIETGRLHEALSLIQKDIENNLSYDKIRPKKHQYSSHTLKKLSEAVNKTQNSELVQKLELTYEYLNHTSTVSQITLEEAIFYPVYPGNDLDRISRFL